MLDLIQYHNLVNFGLKDMLLLDTKPKNLARRKVDTIKQLKRFGKILTAQTNTGFMNYAYLDTKAQLHKKILILV